MMGSVSLPPSEAIDHVQALLQIIADPEKAKEHLAKIKAHRDEISAKHAAASQIMNDVGAREAALKKREEQLAADERRLAGIRAEIEADRAKVNKAMELQKQFQAHVAGM